jgi:hypothetical protein
MELIRSSEIDETEYTRFLDRFAAAPGTALGYHYPFYLRFLTRSAYPSSGLRFVSARDDRGELAGVVPAIHVRTARIDAWLSLAYFGPNAGALVPAAGTPEGASVVRALVAAAQADARSLGCGSMTLYTPLDAAIDPYRAGLGGADFEVERTSQYMEIPAGRDVSPWPRKVRYDIRRARALGLTVRKIEREADLDCVWEIYREHCESKAIPVKPRDHVRCLFRTAGPHGIFLVAERDGEIVAGLICFMGGGVLSFYLPCTRREARSFQPGLLLLDRAVAIARDEGCRLFNFEGSPGVDGSVFRFKARCGGEPVQYHALVKLLRPGVLDEYRAMTSAGLAAEAPHAFLVPFNALS